MVLRSAFAPTWHNARLVATVLAAASATAATSATASAQCPTPSAIERMARPVRVRWTVGNLLVTPDSIHGVSFWFETNNAALIDGRPAQRQFDDRFAPDSLIDWLILTRQLLDLKGPLPNDTSSIVKSGYLRGIDGGFIVVARLRKGKKLADKARLLLYPKSKEPLTIELDRPSVDTLLDVTEAATLRSNFRPAAGESEGATLTRGIPVQWIETRRQPRYPESLRQRSIEGEVWARFCVDVDGRPDLSTFWAPLSDHEGFEGAVKQFLKDARYVPASRNGLPIRQMAAQRFVFALQR